MWSPLGRALVGVVWVVCGALMFALPPDDDSDLSDELPLWGLVVLLAGLALLVHALFQSPPGSVRRSGKHDSGLPAKEGGRDHFRCVVASSIFVLGGAVLVVEGFRRAEFGVVALGVAVMTCTALLLPIAFPSLRTFSRPT